MVRQRFEKCIDAWNKSKISSSGEKMWILEKWELYEK